MLLTSVRGSWLEKVFSGKHDLKYVDDYIFLDRNPIVFDLVLDYLRHGGNYLPRNLEKETFALFSLEIEYWGIGTL